MVLEFIDEKTGINPLMGWGKFKKYFSELNLNLITKEKQLICKKK